MKASAAVPQFAICVARQGDEDLIVGKAYRLLPDRAASNVGCLRVIDESGEDYLYPAKHFVQVRVPVTQRGRLLKAVRTRETQRA